MKIKAKALYIFSGAAYVALCALSPFLFPDGITKNILRMQLVTLIALIPLLIGLLIDYREKKKRGFLIGAIAVCAWYALAVLATSILF